jgi:hypothetical protein
MENNETAQNVSVIDVITTETEPEPEVETVTCYH